jgi:hypothetical protein
MAGHNGGFNPYRDLNGEYATPEAVYQQASKALETFRRVDSNTKATLAGLSKAYASRKDAARILKRTKGPTAQRLGAQLSGSNWAAGRYAGSLAAPEVAAQAKRKTPKA